MYRVVTEWTGLPGMPAYTNLHFEGGSDPAEAQAVADLVEALWTSLNPIVNTAATALVLPDVQQIDPASGAVLNSYGVTTAPVEMNGSGNLQPFASQGLVRLRTNSYVGGREVRGRVFMPGTMDTSDLNGTPNPVYTNALVTAFSLLVTDAAELSTPLVVWSPTRGVNAAVQTVSAWNQWAVLRSRRP